MRKISVLLTLVMVFCVSYPVQAAKKMKLSFQVAYAAPHVVNQEVLIPWSKSFAKETNGNLTVNWYARGTFILDDKESFSALKRGMLDMGLWTPTRQARDFPYSLLTDLPFSVFGARHAAEVYWKLYQEIPELKEELDRPGPLLTMWGPSIGVMFSVNKPIRKPEDIKGKRVLCVMPNVTPMIEAIGGTPVAVSPGDVYVGLQRGMGEIYYATFTFAHSQRIMEVVKHASILPLAGGMQPYSISQRVYDILPQEHKDLLKEKGGRNLSGKVVNALSKKLKLCVDDFKKAGVDISLLTPEEIAAFKVLTDKMVQKTWIPYMTKLGVKNATEVVEKAYEISDSLGEYKIKLSDITK